jgi:hypothetical protein
MGQKQFIPYEAPAAVIRTVLVPRVLCISGGEYEGKAGSFDDDSD